MPKTKTFDQVVAMQRKAVRFLTDVVGDPDRAEEIEDLSPEAYAEHKRIQISNPARKRGAIKMAATRPSRAKLEERIEELEQENETLTDKLDSIVNIVSDDESDDEDD